MEPIFNKIKDLIQSGSGTTLSKDDFSSLKAIYDAQLAQVTSSILESLNFKRKASKIYLSFNKEQLNQLNKGGKISFNPVEMQAFLSDREDIRILDIKLHQVKTSVVEGEVGAFAGVYVKATHSGISRLTKDGQTYEFINVPHDNAVPHLWTSYVAENSGDAVIDIEKPSPLNESLLGSLLGAEASNGNMLYFSQAGANAQITLQVIPHSDFLKPVKIAVDSLILAIEYDYCPQPERLTKIKVTSNIGQAPYIKSSTTDQNGRKDGVGSFLRAYPRSYGQKASFTAPEKVGEYVFTGWSNRSQIPLSDSVCINVSLGNNETLIANYQLMKSELFVNADTIKVPWQGGNFGVILKNTGNIPLEWKLNAKPTNTQTTIESGSIEPDEQFGFSIFFSELVDSIGTTEYLVFNNPDQISNTKTVVVVREAAKFQGQLEKNIVVYPNPITGDNLQVTLANDQYLQKIIILDMQGRKAKEVDFDPYSTREASVDISNLSPGTYFIKIFVDGENLVKKIVKK